MVKKFLKQIISKLGFSGPPYIFDVGMHEGQDTEFYLKKGYHVVAIEANPTLVEQTRERFAEEIKSGRLTIEHCGITEKSGDFTFYLNETHSEWSSFVKEIGIRGGQYKEIQVPCRPLREILKRYPCPYYLKIDIEGHDYIALSAIRGRKKKPKHISVENGSNELLECMRAEGYSQFKFINQGLVHEQVCPEPAKEGKYVDHTFPYGASGLFGEEAPGAWVDYPTICKMVNDYWNIPDRDAVKHGWFDVHAKRD